MSSPNRVHDLLIVGGGINGAGIAADAAGRGLDVVLCEKSDLASATSSASTKLIHGGLRYLEYYQFGLVRKSLSEREVLTRAAPHIVRPMAFQIPLLPHSRSGLMLRAGLFLYDNLVRRRLYKGSRAVSYTADGPLKETIEQGFQYWDAQVDDSRLVILNALQARSGTAQILTYTECVSIQSADDYWHVTLRDHLRQQDVELRCRVLINASGPWVSTLLSRFIHHPASQTLRLVKGSHIVVPKMYQGNNAFLLQDCDDRVVFVIPYLNQYSLIGTTEKDYQGDPDHVSISEDEVSYLIAVVNQYFKKPLADTDIVHTFAGVRPLIEDGDGSATEASRDYRLELISNPCPLLSVYGGKVTTYRVLAEEVMQELRQFFPDMPGAWTETAVLPGGDFEEPEELCRELAGKYPRLDPDLIDRWVHTYGTLSFEILEQVLDMNDLGEHFGAGLYQREVDYLCTKEWAHSVEDILWRRTKLGYRFTDEQKQVLAHYIATAS